MEAEGRSGAGSGSAAISGSGSASGGEDDESPSSLSKQASEVWNKMTDEEKEQLKERASRFATELEECMYELYAEPDKTGKQSVAAKYKYVSLPK